MRKIIQTCFDKAKYYLDRERELKNLLFEKYGVREIEELERIRIACYSFNSLEDFRERLKNEINEELDKRINEQDYKTVKEYPLLNIVLDTNYNFIYIVLSEDGTPKQLWQKDGEYKIIDESK